MNDEDLHAAAEAEHQVQGGLLLDVVVGKGRRWFPPKLEDNDDR